MTDLPRRSYPLVVPPPGGFEDAVKRGRRLRRKKAGGSTGAALALVGLLAFSTMGGNSGTNGLQITDDRPIQEQPVPPVVGATPTAAPTTAAPADPKPTTGGRPVASAPRGGTVTGPSSAPTARPPEATRPPRGSNPSPRRYAARADITRGDAMTGSATECPPELGQRWCAYPRVDPGPTYRLSYVLCRQVDAGPGVVHFDRTIEANFSTTEKATDDTVWTYTAGQPVRKANTSATIDPGSCMEWYTYWDGYDDFGYYPPSGQYILTTRSLGTSDEVLPTVSIEFTYE